MAIREKAAVKVINGFYEGKTGKVVKIHDYADVAIVSFDDNGDLGKVSLSELVEINPQRPAESEIPEGAKKISRADFEAALFESIQFIEEYPFRNPKSGAIGVTVGNIVGANIGDKIFKDQDVAVMTEDRFIAVLWDGCSPESVREIVGGNMPVGTVKNFSIAAISILGKISEILFGGDND